MLVLSNPASGTSSATTHCLPKQGHSAVLWRDTANSAPCLLGELAEHAMTSRAMQDHRTGSSGAPALSSQKSPIAPPPERVMGQNLDDAHRKSSAPGTCSCMRSSVTTPLAGSPIPGYEHDPRPAILGPPETRVLRCLVLEHLSVPKLFAVHVAEKNDLPCCTRRMPARVQ